MLSPNPPVRSFRSGDDLHIRFAYKNRIATSEVREVGFDVRWTCFHVPALGIQRRPPSTTKTQWSDEPTTDDAASTDRQSISAHTPNLHECEETKEETCAASHEGDAPRSPAFSWRCAVDLYSISERADSGRPSRRAILSACHSGKVYAHIQVSTGLKRQSKSRRHSTQVRRNDHCRSRSIFASPTGPIWLGIGCRSALSISQADLSSTAQRDFHPGP